MKLKNNSQAVFVKTALRLPPDLHSAVHEAAKESERTYNGEIIHRLRTSLRGSKGGGNRSRPE